MNDEPKVIHIQDVVDEYNLKAKRLIEMVHEGVVWVTEQNGEYVPHLPDNVVIFPTHGRMQ